MGAENEPPDDATPRAEARALADLWIRGVPSRRNRAELGGTGEPRDEKHDHHERNVAEGPELQEIPRRIPAEPVPECKRPDDERRAEKAGGDEREPGPRPTRPHVRQPDPKMQRRQEEDQCERVRRHDEERERREAEQRGGRPGELLLCCHPPARQETLARDEPAGEREDPEHQDPERGPVTCRAAGQRRRPGRAAGPQPDEREELEHERDPGPQGETASVAAEGGRERDPPPPAAREQVDRGREEREEHRHQHELHRPAADQPRTDVDVRRRPLHELGALIERPEQVLRRPAYLAEAAGIETVERVGRGRGGAVTRRRQRDGRDST